MLEPRKDTARPNGEGWSGRRANPQGEGQSQGHYNQKIGSGATLITDRLDKVRQTGPGRWIACCPAHGDKSPSLAVRELDDGRILLHCFTGCSVEEVLSAMSLTFDALFPERPATHHVRGERRPFPATDILRCLSFEASIVLSCAASVLDGRFTAADRERLSIAVGRFHAALTA